MGGEEEVPEEAVNKGLGGKRTGRERGAIKLAYRPIQGVLRKPGCVFSRRVCRYIYIDVSFAWGRPDFKVFKEHDKIGVRDQINYHQFAIGIMLTSGAHAHVQATLDCSSPNPPHLTHQFNCSSVGRIPIDLYEYYFDFGLDLVWDLCSEGVG